MYCCYYYHAANRSAQTACRRGVWEYHLDYIQQHNLEADRGTHTFWVGVNEYADMVSIKSNRHFSFNIIRAVVGSAGCSN
jgi:cathepsin L